jgi:hypothetical protein
VYLIKEKSERGYLVPNPSSVLCIIHSLYFLCSSQGKENKKTKGCQLEKALNWKASFSQWIGPNPIGDSFLGVALSGSFEWDIF